MERVGSRVEEQREGTGWYSFGGQGERASWRHKVFFVFFMCVFGVWSVRGRGSEWESGSSGKDPSGPHLAAT